MKLGLVFSTIAFLTACNGCSKPSPTPVEPTVVITLSDGAVSPSMDMCTAACTVLRDLSCPEGNASDSGQTCESKCATLSQLDEVKAEYLCVSKSRSTDDLVACNVRCMH